MQNNPWTWDMRNLNLCRNSLPAIACRFPSSDVIYTLDHSCMAINRENSKMFWQIARPNGRDVNPI